MSSCEAMRSAWMSAMARVRRVRVSLTSQMVFMPPSLIFCRGW